MLVKPVLDGCRLVLVVVLVVCVVVDPPVFAVFVFCVWL